MSATLPHETEAPVAHETVEVSYDGITKSLKAAPNEAVQALLEQALNAFGIHNNRHTQALYTTEGGELTDSQSLQAAGVTPGAHLLLRPSQVKGGIEAEADSQDAA